MFVCGDIKRHLCRHVLMRLYWCHVSVITYAVCVHCMVGLHQQGMANCELAT